MRFLRSAQTLIERGPGVDDVLDDEELTAGGVGRQVAQDLHIPGGARSLAVGGDLKEVDGQRGLQPLREIAQEEDGSLQNPHEQQRPTVLIPVDLRREAADPLLQRGGVDESSA
jgi:hypothetical protein